VWLSSCTVQSHRYLAVWGQTQHHLDLECNFSTYKKYLQIWWLILLLQICYESCIVFGLAQKLTKFTFLSAFILGVLEGNFWGRLNLHHVGNLWMLVTEKNKLYNVGFTESPMQKKPAAWLRWTYLTVSSKENGIRWKGGKKWKDTGGDKRWEQGKRRGRRYDLCSLLLMWSEKPPKYQFWPNEDILGVSVFTHHF